MYFQLNRKKYDKLHFLISCLPLSSFMYEQYLLIPSRKSIIFELFFLILLLWDLLVETVVLFLYSFTKKAKIWRRILKKQVLQS